MNDQAIEKEIQSKGLTAPRVTPADVEANIIATFYFTATDAIAPPVGEMVNRFLGWKLPKDFYPDCGISFDGRGPDARGYDLGWPTGTNILHAGQAKEMFEACAHTAPKHKALDLLTFCVLVLQNGFTVTGESACASPENFDAELGRKITRENAVNKLWPLMGYALKQRLHEAAKP